MTLFKYFEKPQSVTSNDGAGPSGEATEDASAAGIAPDTDQTGMALDDEPTPLKPLQVKAKTTQFPWATYEGVNEVPKGTKAGQVRYYCPLLALACYCSGFYDPGSLCVQQQRNTT